MLSRYNWTVTFTSDFNGANVPELVATYSDLTGAGATAVVTTLRDGNELSGTFNVSFAEPVREGERERERESSGGGVTGGHGRTGRG